MVGITKKGVDSRIEKRAGKFLKSKGFVIDRFGSFVKDENDFITNIGFGVYTTSNIKGHLIISYGLGIRIKMIESIWEKYKDILGETRQPLAETMGFSRSVINPESDKYPDHLYAKGGGEFVKTEEDVFAFVDTFKEEYERLIIPFINKVTQLEWMDNVINEKIDNTPLKTDYFGNPGFWYRRMIIAKMNNNAYYEEIYQWIKNRFKKGFEETGKEKYRNIVIVLDKLHNDLNEKEVT